MTRAPARVLVAKLGWPPARNVGDRKDLLMIKGTFHEAVLPGRAAFSVAEASLHMGLGRDAIYHAIRSGQLVARKVGRRTLITQKDLHRFLASLPKAGASQAA
jgi:excisionase family DNA binding protein